jgi:predicted methyltransferase
MIEAEITFYLTASVADEIARAMESGLFAVKISPDLNLTHTIIHLKEGGVVLGGKHFKVEVLRDFAKKESGILLCRGGEEVFLQIHKERFYKLKPTAFAPTVEIDGIQMHRTKGIDPWEDSRRKAGQAVAPGDLTLDTCGGLGYTAIWAVKLGAKRVISVEKDVNIIALRELNPHSVAFFESPIQARHDDIADNIGRLSDESFDSVIHDPPRFSLAGELYGGGFYREMFRALKSGGRLFHYTGDPYSKGRGRNFYQGVMNRLRTVGFEVTPIPRDLGILAQKL